jgi:diaminohydroxyphosphoribosylaminopyrimidine deaminase/5-amino-6-(5-phosphoribosylamino)uracil reductase
VSAAAGRVKRRFAKGIEVIGSGMVAGEEVESEAAWRGLLALSDRRRRGAPLPLVAALAGSRLTVTAPEAWRVEPALAPPLAALVDLYLPLCLAERFVVAHLGQSLDGRIATSGGLSRWVTGAADIAHNHRMRALADAVLVGASTLRHDDPQLTVRSCCGGNPVRVILDSNRTLDAGYRVCADGAAPTLILVAADKAGPGERLGLAELLPLPCSDAAIDPETIIATLAARGLRRLFVEGGGVTVSRFLARGCLDRLQITVSPLIIGSGRPSISLPEIEDLRHGLRPPTRRFDLGEDVMFECRLK